MEKARVPPITYSTPCRFANVLSKKHRLKKTLPPSNYRTRTESRSQQQQLRSLESRFSSHYRNFPQTLADVQIKANSERNGAFSGDSSTNSKSFEGKVHLHRSSLSDSKDVAKIQQNSEITKLSSKKHCLLSYHSALIAGASVKAAHGAALLSGLSSTEEPGCSELLRPAVCSFRTIASVLRRLESRTSAIIGYCLKLPGRTCVPGTFLTLQ